MQQAFYERPVLEVARDLIGCTVRHGLTCGVIVETEAYHHCEPACHAYVGVTPRTATLFGPPGVAYVYRSYGVHAMLNAVCERAGVAAAVLIRALEPVQGVDAMAARRSTDRIGDLCSGPGKLTQALAITLQDNGRALDAAPLVIGPPLADRPGPPIVTGPRVGITKAVDLPWRFAVRGSPFVSRPVPG